MKILHRRSDPGLSVKYFLNWLSKLTLIARFFCAVLIFSSVYISPSQAQQEDTSDQLLWLQYIASHPDLINAFGTNWNMGRDHYESFGRGEKREFTFNACNYIASHPYYLDYFKKDLVWATRHYIVAGSKQNDQVRFNSYEYMMANPDVQRAFDGDLLSACFHYHDFGRYEGRKIRLSEGGLIVSQWKAGMCILATSGSLPNLVLDNCKDLLLPQQWRFDDKGQILQTSPTSENRCITPVNYSLNSGTELISWPCTEHKTQRWEVRENGAIASKDDPGKCIDINSTTNGASGSKLMVYHCYEVVNQRWSIAGSVKLVLFGNKCADSQNSQLGTPIVLRECMHGYAVEQYWSFNAKGQIVGFGGVSCITPNSFSLERGTQLFMWRCSADRPEQRWTMDGDGNLVNEDNPDMCIATAGGRRVHGVQLVVEPCWKSVRQKWVAAYGVKYEALGKCLTANTGIVQGNVAVAQDADVILRECIPIDKGQLLRSQQWVFDGRQLKSFDNYCLAMSNSVNPSGWNSLYIRKCENDNLATHWYARQNGQLASGNYPGLCVDVYGGNTQDGIAVGASPCHNGANQKWTQR